LRLLNHSIRYPGDSLMRRVLAGLAGQAADGLAGAVTSSSLISYLLRTNEADLPLVEARSTGEFALATPSTRRFVQSPPVVEARRGEQLHVLPNSPQLVRVVCEEAIRLVSTRLPKVSLFDPAADQAKLDALVAIEALTNARVRDETGQVDLVPPEDRVTGAGATIVMAAFTHPNPRGSRFSDGSYGVLYVCDRLETAVAEVSHHQSLFLSLNKAPATDIALRVYGMRVDARLYDMRNPGLAGSSVFDPDGDEGSIRLGNQLRQSGADGVVYHSVLHKPGTLFALFKPRAVSNVRATGDVILHWDGTRIANWSHRELPAAQDG
jgi:hypothetical protein